MGRIGRKGRAPTAGFAGQPVEADRQGGNHKDIGDEQGLEHQGQPQAPGALLHPANQEQGQQGGGKAPGQAAGEVVQEKGHKPEDAHRQPAEETVSQGAAQAVNTERQENEEQSGENLGKEDGVRHPGGQPVEALDPPGNVEPGVVAEEIALEQGRVAPLLHPEELLTHVVVDDVRVGQRGQVGDAENRRRHQGHRQRVPSAASGLWLGFSGFRWLFQKPGKFYSVSPL
jgi:hypothetical protein